MNGTYRLKEPLALTNSGPLWRAVNDANEPRIIRFISQEVASAQAARLEKLAHLRHPNVMRLVDVTAHEGRCAMVCEEAEGTPLNVLLDQPGAITPQRAYSIAVEIARGIQALHHHGVTHGDLSTANVIVGDSAVIVDLIDSPGATDSFAAPELTSGNNYGENMSCVQRRRCDIWSWGQIVEALGTCVPLADAARSVDPDARPSIDEIVAAQCDVPVEGIPPSDTDPQASSAASLLRTEADRERTHHRGAPARHRRSRRTGRLKPRVIAVCAVMAMIVAAIYAVHAGGITASHADAPQEAVGASQVCPTQSDARRIVQDLTRRRAIAVMEADTSALASIYTENSAMKESDNALIEQMLKQKISIQNLSTSVTDMSVHNCSTRMSVRATLAQEAHMRCSHGICSPVAAQEPHVVMIELVGPPWRIKTVTRG